MFIAASRPDHCRFRFVRSDNTRYLFGPAHFEVGIECEEEQGTTRVARPLLGTFWTEADQFCYQLILVDLLFQFYPATPRILNFNYIASFKRFVCNLLMTVLFLLGSVDQLRLLLP